jgi:hypothetical protein
MLLNNVHGNIVDIGKGLKLFGYGGCHKAIVEVDGKFEKEIWEPFPFDDEEDYGTGLKSVVSQLTHEYPGFTDRGFAIENSKNSITKPSLLFILSQFPCTPEYSTSGEFQAICVTHIGPYSSKTAQDYDTEKDINGVVHAGSTTLEDILSEHQDMILCNIHGHNHYSKKQDKIGEVPIINVNNLYDYNYGELYLELNGETQKWEVKDIQFHKLEV